MRKAIVASSLLVLVAMGFMSWYIGCIRSESDYWRAEAIRLDQDCIRLSNALIEYRERGGLSAREYHDIHCEECNAK